MPMWLKISILFLLFTEARLIDGPILGLIEMRERITIEMRERIAKSRLPENRRTEPRNTIPITHWVTLSPPPQRRLFVTGFTLARSDSVTALWETKSHAGLKHELRKEGVSVSHRFDVGMWNRVVGRIGGSQFVETSLSRVGLERYESAFVALGRVKKAV